MIKGIVCIGAHNVMGKDGSMPWGDRPLDGKHFRELTEGHVVVMGRKTFESMHYKPLPKRTNVVLTRTPHIFNRSIRSQGFVAVRSVQDVLRLDTEGKDLWIIGGAEVYREFLPYIEEFYITTVGGEFEGDTFFPDINEQYAWRTTLLWEEWVRIAKPVEPPVMGLRTQFEMNEHLVHCRKFTKVSSVTDNKMDMYSGEHKGVNEQ